jgi:hypothetical protein
VVDRRSIVHRFIADANRASVTQVKRVHCSSRLRTLMTSALFPEGTMGVENTSERSNFVHASFCVPNKRSMSAQRGSSRECGSIRFLYSWCAGRTQGRPGIHTSARRWPSGTSKKPGDRPRRHCGSRFWPELVVAPCGVEAQNYLRRKSTASNPVKTETAFDGLGSPLVYDLIRHSQIFHETFCDCLCPRRAS